MTDNTKIDRTSIESFIVNEVKSPLRFSADFPKKIEGVLRDLTADRDAWISVARTKDMSLVSLSQEIKQLAVDFGVSPNESDALSVVGNIREIRKLQLQSANVTEGFVRFIINKILTQIETSKTDPAIAAIGPGAPLLAAQLSVLIGAYDIPSLLQEFRASQP